MGTTLTGTTPQDTYDSLIKVTDNGPLSGTLKKLTDGLGNDSSLSLSTTAASFSGSLTISGDTVGSKFYTAGSAVPTAAVSVFLNANYGGPAYNSSSFVTGNGATGVMIGGDTASYTYGWIQGVQTDNGNAKGLVLQPISGNVGIGTTSPSTKLHVAGNGFFGGTNANIYIDNGGVGGSSLILGCVGTSNGYIATDGPFPILIQPNNTTRVRIDSDGLKFNADTAAANALDDYEEGTWTPVFTMGTSGTITMDSVLGRYTKVGNLVTCTGYANIASVSSPVGELRLGGLPFTTGSGADASISLFIYNFGNTTAVTAYQGLVSQSLNYAIIRGYNNGGQVQNIGDNVIGGAGMIFTITYRV